MNKLLQSVNIWTIDLSMLYKYILIFCGLPNCVCSTKSQGTLKVSMNSEDHVYSTPTLDDLTKGRPLEPGLSQLCTWPPQCCYQYIGVSFYIVAVQYNAICMRSETSTMLCVFSNCVGDHWPVLLKCSHWYGSASIPNLEFVRYELEAGL